MDRLATLLHQLNEADKERQDNDSYAWRKALQQKYRDNHEHIKYKKS